MVYNIPKYSGNKFTCFAIWENGFTEDELEKVIFLENLQSFEKGQVGSTNDVADPKVRNSDVSWIVPDNNSDWLFARLSSIISKVNYDHFMYDIDGIESLQYTKYAENQHYNWHWDVDFGWNTFTRKISMVMLLSDPNEYEGGEFEICINGNLNDIKQFKPNKGDILFFSSWMPHKVNPVISGERKSLVTWVMGKREC